MRRALGGGFLPDGEGDGLSWDEMAERAGVDLGEPSAPFDGYRRDLNLEVGLYWPAVPAEADARPRLSLPQVP
jgi:hypothetical protein